MVMIQDVDETLKAVIEREVINGSEVDVTLDAPTKDWAARQSGPSINAFLYDIREDTSRRDVAPMPVYDESGRIIGRKAPFRRFRLSYLLTAWTQRPEEEHRLLSQLLSVFLGYDEFAEDDLVGALIDADVPTVVTLALPPPQDRSLSDIWSSLGGELKPSLDLVVVAPFDPSREFATGPPVLEKPRFTVADFEVEPDDVVAERRARNGVPRRVPVEDLDDPPGSERRQVGEDSHPGRTFEIKRKQR